MRALCTAVLLLVAGLPAQDRLLGILRTPAGDPPQGAVVLFVPDPWPDLPALEGFQSGAAPRRVPADERGEFRLPATTPGGLLITTPEGLGAWRRPVSPGVPERLVLLPMAEIALAEGGAFTAWPAALGADGRAHALPPAEGAALRLPAGSYELWLEFRGRPAVHRLDLLSGQRVRLPEPPPPRLLGLPEGFVERGGAWPLGRPDVALPWDGERLSLPGRGAPFSLVLHDGDDGRLHRLWVDEQHPTAGTWQPPPAPEGGKRRIEMLLDGVRPESAELWLLRGGRTGWTPVGLLRGPGPHEIPAHPDLEWLARAQGAAPTCGHSLETGKPVFLLPATDRLVEVLLPDGLPAEGAEVWWVPDEGPAASLRARTDSRGRARTGPVRGAFGRLKVTHPGGLPVDLGGLAGHEVVRVQLESGAALRGTVQHPDGRPAEGVPVTLRDPQTWPLPERTVLTDADGAFAFTGLPEDRPFVLRAAVVRGPLTLAAQVTRAVARQAPWELRLRSEDPALPGRVR